MNNRYEIRNPKNSKEFSEGIKLAQDIFGKKNPNYFFKKNKFDNVVIIKDIKDDIIIGFAINIIRISKIYNKYIKVAFISSICIHKNYRKLGLSILLIEKSIQNLKKHNIVIAYVIARKKLNYYYNQLNFFGVSSFPKLVIKKNFFENIISNKKIISSNVNKEDLFYVNNIYSKVYVTINGFFKRSNSYWEFIFIKCRHQNISFKKYILNNKIVGYAVYLNNEIYEIATNNKIFYNLILKNFSKKLLSKNILFFVNNSHEMNGEFINMDIKYSYRRINYGGHLMKIIDMPLLIKIYNNNQISVINNKFTNNPKKFISYFIKSNIYSGFDNNTLNKQDFYINTLDQI